MSNESAFLMGLGLSILVFAAGRVLVGQKLKTLKNPPWYVGFVILVADVYVLFVANTNAKTLGQAFFWGTMVIPIAGSFMLAVLLLVATMIKRINNYITNKTK